MPLTKDWREFIELLNSNGVDFLIVGAVAVAWHGHPRFTGDIDFLVRPTPANAACVVDVLRQFGFSQLGITPSDLVHPDRILQLGCPPNRIDILTSISGVPFDDAWAGRIQGEMDGVIANFIGVDELIRNKEATGRGKDMGDAIVLRQRRPKP
jgi:hypothetical protein